MPLKYLKAKQALLSPNLQKVVAISFVVKKVALAKVVLWWVHVGPALVCNLLCNKGFQLKAKGPIMVRFNLKMPLIEKVFRVGNFGRPRTTQFESPNFATP